MRWLIAQWPYATLLAAGFLLVCAPAFLAFISIPLLVVYLQLPVYMVHQFEEHDQDRFRIFINKTLAGGRNALTPGATFFINSVGVWGVDLVAFYLALFVDFGWGLIAVDLALFNAIVHVVAALVKRCYNPGLWTGILIFLPFCGWSYSVLLRFATPTQQIVAFVIALVIHVLIVVHVKLRVRQLDAAATA